MKLFTVRERAIKGIEFTKEEKIDLVGVPFGEAMTKNVERFEKGASLRLDNADVVPDGDFMRLVTEQHSNDKRALVKVETAAGVGGVIRLAARPLAERLCKKSGWVLRENVPVEKAVGVTVLTHTNDAFLVLMDPGASFMIVRTGRLEGGPPELAVQWNGRWDQKGVSAIVARMDDSNARWPTPEELLWPWAFRVAPYFERHKWVDSETSSTP